MNYIPLNIKTHYDLLSSIIKIDDLIDYALKNNIKVLGINDRFMFSFPEFYNLCIKNDIKPIIGVPLSINDVKFDIYPSSFKGYKNACKLVSISNISSLKREHLIKYSEEVIVVLDKCSYKYYKLFNEIFDKVYLSFSDDKEREEALKITNNILFRNEVRCFYKSDYEYLKYLYMIRDGKTIKEDVTYEIKDNHFLESVSEIDARSTIEFSNLIDISLPDFKFKIPKINDEDSSTYLRNLVYKGLNKRLNNNLNKEYIDRLEYELSIIENMGFVDYFLVVYDYILFAKKNDILVGPGRGSGVSSLVSYSLGIIDIDPLKYDLIFERFLNPDRISLPDIDTDFEDKRRDEVINYVKEKYGSRKCANIISFDTLLPKACLRDVGKVIEMDSFLLDKICKCVHDEKSFKELENKPIFKATISSDEDYSKLLDICKRLDGLKRHTSIHAAGVVISGNDISDVCPLYKSGETILTTYTKDYIESYGLIKMDLLAVSNLTTIKNVVNRIEEYTSKKIDLNKIPLDDKKTLDLFKNADTIGVFQFEGTGIRTELRRLETDSFDDLVAMTSLYRPGPKDEIPTYIKRKHGKEKITYEIDELESILSSTYGVIVYQEQVLKILRTIADYTYAEADIIRKAMSKKNESVISKERVRFIERASKKYDKDLLNNLFDKIQKFSLYSFNKSHAVAYSIISYWMQYLKANYKECFMSILLDTVISSEDKTKLYIDEARLLKIDFVLPKIDKSGVLYKVEDDKIIFPLSVIKNLSRDISNKIVLEREKGEFKDYFDFVRRVSVLGVTKKNILSLIDADALNVFGYNKKTLTENLGNALNYASLCNETDEELVMKPVMNEYSEFQKEELAKKEFDSYGFYYSNHPVTKYRRYYETSLEHIEDYFDKRINTVCLIEGMNVIETKDHEKMAFATVSDEFRKVDMVIFPREFKNYYDLDKGRLIRLRAKVEKRMGEYQLVVSEIRYIEES